MIKSTRMDVVTTYKSIRNLSFCVEKRGRVRMGGWLQLGRGEVGWGRRRRNRVSAEWVYIDYYRWNHRWTRSVGESTGDRATSLYGDPGLNPLVIPSVKSSEKIHVITPLQLSKKTV
jgi:hypothetical protein